MGESPNLPDADFIAKYNEIGPNAFAREMGFAVSSIHKRRVRLESKYGIQIAGPEGIKRNRHIPPPHRLQAELRDGIVIIASDAHYWPGEPTTGHRALVKFCKDLQPDIMCMNGDVIDGASVSRHPPLGWTRIPSLLDEIEVAQERLHEIQMACPKKTSFFWQLGNHDARLENRIADRLPELASLKGTQLKDHFGEAWKPCLSVWINDHTVIKHRMRGGIHAVHNNLLWSGKNIVTGHLHSLKVVPLSDYNDTRFGVDTGCIADRDAAAFRYLEDNPTNWRSGFAVLTFRDGRLMWPELVHVIGEGEVEFRSEIHQV